MALAVIRGLGRLSAHWVDPWSAPAYRGMAPPKQPIQANLTLPVKHPLARGGILRQRYDSRERVSSSGGYAVRSR